jgi:hypothetical protein
VQEEIAMVYVVEIENQYGHRAIKEYDEPDGDTLILAMDRDLAKFPSCRVLDGWPKDKPEQSIFG